MKTAGFLSLFLASLLAPAWVRARASASPVAPDETAAPAPAEGPALPAAGPRSAKSDAVRFPLRVRPDGRCLEDQEGRPFLYQADTAWMLFLNLTLEESEEYFSARREQGFNVVQLQLTGFLGMANRAGHLPFEGESDFSRPSEAFFAHVDAVIAKGAAENLLLAIAPLWVGCCGEGWAGTGKDGAPKPMNVNGAEKCRALGLWLGRRYARFENILWILGGDNDPHESRDVIRELALGLKEAAPRHLLTYHAASSHSSTDAWADSSWIDAPMIYTYFRGFDKAWNKSQPDVYEAGYMECRKRPRKPFFLGESTYEGEHGDWGSPLQARKQAYWAMLAGATGHAYGSPLWRCDKGWREELSRPGARSLIHLRRLFGSRPWWRLVPDEANEVAVGGRGPFAANDHATTALADDRSFAISYLPSPRDLVLDTSRVSGDRRVAWWFDPRTGEAARVGEVPAGAHRFRPPAEGDWVLVVEDAAKEYPPPGQGAASRR